MAKGVKASSSFDKRWITVGVLVAGATALLARLLTWRPAAKKV
jgi:hypothetical protein